jgi:hypothetical protein
MIVLTLLYLYQQVIDNDWPPEDKMLKDLKLGDETYSQLRLCHGPGALLSTTLDKKFLYDGFKMAVFPDAVDE